jgi:hypothetical protein|tara:strand:- start:9839 stop:11323 length:1485 start_codon:yes stop_codon:yes gene_type:complete
LINYNFIKFSFKYHKFCGWVGGIALIIFAISGLIHPILTWTGPKSDAFFLPQGKIEAEDVVSVKDIIVKNNIRKIIIAKLMPSKDGIVLQISQDKDGERRYFDIKTHQELIGHDKKHAIWLARYYTGLKNAQVKSVKFQDKFDNSYPWVNRLLPVYKVTFDTKDERTAFIYTEINALSGLTNSYKTSMQSIFRAMHSWNWLDEYEIIRVALMLFLLLSLFIMIVTGVGMIFFVKNRNMPLRRKFHRYLSYIIYVPLAMFTFSGVYHLLQYSYSDNYRGMKLQEQFSIEPEKFDKKVKWIDQYSEIKLNSISLVKDPEGEDILYRLSFPKGLPGGNISLGQKFDGMATEGGGVYYSAISGERSHISDRYMAINYAKKLVYNNDALVKGAKVITRFGPDYDFRNKRLPVWQVDLESDIGDRLYIDPSASILVDRLADSNRYEGYSFSFLHKWNFLTPVIGRYNRDIIIAIIILSAFILAISGYIIKISIFFKRKKK